MLAGGSLAPGSHPPSLRLSPLCRRSFTFGAERLLNELANGFGAGRSRLRLARCPSVDRRCQLGRRSKRQHRVFPGWGTAALFGYYPY